MEKLVAGLDIGGTKSAVLLAKASLDQVEFYGRKEIPTVGSCNSVLEQLFQLLYELLAENGRTAVDLASVGVSCGGPLDENTGIIICPSNLPGWENFEICRLITEEFGCKAFLMNDANACALAEYRYGAGRGKQNVIFLTFGTGLGAGLVLNGRLYSGTNGNAGEVGHIRLEPDGPLGYGKYGSFEGFCSGGGIARTAARYFENTSQITPTAKELFLMAEQGDEDALKIYSMVGKRFGRGLALLVDMLNPEMIIVGGVFMRAEKYIRKSMEEELQKEALSCALECVEIVPSMLREQIGDYGAVVAAVENLQ